MSSLFQRILPLLELPGGRTPIRASTTLRAYVPVRIALRPASATFRARRSFAVSSRVRQVAGPAAATSADGVNTDPSLKVEPRLSITFTCTASLPSPITTSDSSAGTEPAEHTNCNHRSTHQFTRRSYEKGIVLIQCPGCKNRHLIADHLGWFEDSTLKGQHRTIEEIIRAKGQGETVKRGVKYEYPSGTAGTGGEMGDLEIVPRDEAGSEGAGSMAKSEVDRLRIE